MILFSVPYKVNEGQRFYEFNEATKQDEHTHTYGWLFERERS